MRNETTKTPGRGGGLIYGGASHGRSAQAVHEKSDRKKELECALIACKPHGVLSDSTDVEPATSKKRFRKTTQVFEQTAAIKGTYIAQATFEGQKHIFPLEVPYCLRLTAVDVAGDPPPPAPCRGLGLAAADYYVVCRKERHSGPFGRGQIEKCRTEWKQSYGGRLLALANDLHIVDPANLCDSQSSSVFDLARALAILEFVFRAAHAARYGRAAVYGNWTHAALAWL
ncbi:unnamed protein product, partial [Iphiclides podalirius]